MRLRGWLIFIRISNSDRPTVLTVGSWFVVWLLNNRPALHTVAYVGAWLINSQATNHEPYQKCRPAKNLIFKQTRRVSGAKTQQGGPRFGVQKKGPVWGSVSYVDIARYSFSNMEPKKRCPFFHLKIGVSFCRFSVVAIALLRLRGWLIFIRISNSDRPTVLTVGSWFVVWLLNNRPALHTVAYVGAWLINSQATNHEPYQKCRPAKNLIFKQTRRVSGAKTQQKPSQFHQKADPVLGSKKRAPFGGPFPMLTLRAIPFPIWNPKKGSIFPPQNWGFFLLFFCCCYCTFAPEGLVNFYSHFQF